MAQIRINKGLTRRARRLGLNNSGYLSRVVQGKVENLQLLARYRALVAEEEAAGPLSEQRKVVTEGTAIAEKLGPLLRAANSSRERRVIHAELRSGLPPHFWEAADAIRDRLPVGELRRFQAAFSPFFAEALA